MSSGLASLVRAKEEYNMQKEDMPAFVRRTKDSVGPLSPTLSQIRMLQDQVDIYGGLLQQLRSRLVPVTVTRLEDCSDGVLDEAPPFESNSPIAQEIEATLRAQRRLNGDLGEIISLLEI